LAFTGCATKEPPVVFKPQVICFDFEKYQLTPKVNLELKLEEEELEVLNSRADELHQTIIFYEVQIDNYKELCKKYQLLSNSLQLKEK
jgi:hypothetical protein